MGQKMGKLLKMFVFITSMFLNFDVNAQVASSCQLYAHELMFDGQKVPQPFLTPRHVLSIKDGFTFGQPTILVRLNRVGAKVMARYSEKNLHKQFVVLCGTVELSKPYVQTRLTNLLSITYTKN